MVVHRHVFSAATLTVSAMLCAGCASVRETEWPYVGGDAEGTRYSTLTQINRENVRDLSVAWEFHTGGLRPGNNSSLSCTPVVVDGVMYLTGVDSTVFALDAATGREMWRFNPHRRPRAFGSRGVAYWSDGRPNGQRRIILATTDGKMFSIDARVGTLDPAFGRDGVAELRDGIEERDISDTLYAVTSAPAIYQDLIVLGFAVGEGYVSAPGDIRAFDVRTGKPVWRFHSVPRPGEEGHDTWLSDGWKNRGGVNAWGGVRIDQKHGMVFAGFGSASYDWYGGDRPGNNLFANAVVALDARTGKRLWHYQTIHHDLLDYDLPSAPTLVTINKGGQQIEAVVQGTKQGHLWVFDRATGKPLWGAEERPVPASTIPGEWTAPTQPFPLRPPALVRQGFSDADVTDVSPEATAYIRNKIKVERLRYQGMYTPGSIEGTLVMPGFHGGATWSGVSYDPTTNLAYVNVNDMATVIALRRDEKTGRYFTDGYRYGILKDQFGLPGVKPPWGYLMAVDLGSGEITWKTPFGTWPGAERFGLKDTGTENFGGGIVTAGGLIFIGSTMDAKFHVFDKTTGEKLWEYQLPVAAYAQPATYSVDGRQYVVIAAGGGGKPMTPTGDSFIAFALPNHTSRTSRLAAAPR